MLKKIWRFISLFCAVYQLQGQNNVQSKNILLQQDYSDALQEWNILYPSEEFHAAYKPYLSSSINSYQDTVFKKKAYPKIKSLALSQVFNDVPNKRNQFQLQALPVIHSIQGYDGAFTSENGLGTQVYFNINNDFTAYGNIVGYRSSFPFFLDTAIYQTQLIRNIGFPANNKNHVYSYLYWNAYVSYSKSFFNFQAGRGKMFIGNGYRSLLLSDIASPYPYLKLQANFWKIQYNVYYLLLNHYIPGSNVDNVQKKYATMHSLSLNVNKKFNVLLFENVVWQGSDTSRSRGFDPTYLSPAVFLRPQEYQQGSSDNVMMGINLSYIVTKKLQLYGQLGLDEFYLKEIRAGRGWWANKQAWQLGVYFLNFAGIQNLNLRVEYNEAKPYTYSHGAPAQNYAHQGMPLAHPFGANFRELVVTCSYSIKKWNFRLHNVYAEIGKDSLNAKSNVGQNIFLSYTTRAKEYNNYTLQGVRTYFNHLQADISYLLVPVMNMRLQASVIYRKNRDVSYNLDNVWIGLGVSCNVFNFYRDY
ncbi:MAG: capsule assembly Wzi family protein [Bacteroidia bacterium]|nr:capsule assembly Wzi family protein [Bacteroidia bacterium]